MVKLPLALADVPNQPLLERLDPQTRAKVLMALLALVLAGLALVALAFLGGRYVRRLIARPLGATRAGQENWFQKPLIQPDADLTEEDDERE